MNTATKYLKRQGVVLCVSGPSGVGKGTLVSRIREARPKLQLSVSVTTRAPRPGEEEGVSYYFRSKEEFERLLDEGQILEYDQYCGNYYGTLRAPIEAAQEAGENIILDVTVEGALSVKKNAPSVCTIFILPPSHDSLRQRLAGRGTETEELIEARLNTARLEIKYADAFDYVLINDSLEDCASVLCSILDAEEHKRDNLLGFEEYRKRL